MLSVHRLITFGMVGFLAIQLVTAQTPDGPVRVGLVPIAATDVRIPSAATGAIDDTLQVTLQFLPGYVAHPLTGVDVAAATDSTLLDAAADGALDYIVFGTAARNDAGDIVMDLRVFNHATRSIAHREQAVAESVMDLFDVSDRLIVSLIEQFSDIRVEYGTLMISIPDVPVQRDPDNAVAVAVDGIPVSDELRSVTIDRMVAGEHTVSVHSSGGHYDWNGSVMVLPDETATVHPLVSAVDETTRDEIDRIVNRIVRVFTIRRGDRTIEDEFARARGLVSETGGYYGQQLRSKLDYLYTGLTAPSKPIPMLPIHPAPGASFDNTSPVFLGTQISLLRDSLAPYREITIDGEEDDWEDISPLATDPIGDVHPDSDLIDINALYVAMDEQFLYVRYSVPDGRIPVITDVRYDLNVRGQPPGPRVFLRITPGRDDIFEAQVAIFDGTDSFTIEREDNSVATGAEMIEARFSLKHLRDVVTGTLTLESFAGYADDPYSSLPTDKREERVEFSPHSYLLY